MRFKIRKLAVLLGLNQPPTRASLLRDIVRMNVVVLASPQLQDLYSWLEVDFHPLELCSRVNSVIQTLQIDETSPLSQYVVALQDVTLVRLVHQVSQVYQTIQFARLLDLAKFTDAFHLERLLVDCVRYNNMQMRIDHGKRCIHFGVDLSEAQREDHPDGPVLQAMPSEQIRCQLVNMATVLHRAINVINPNKRKQEREKLRTQMVALYHETKNKEHHRILERQVIIEQRKEYIERVNTIREEEELRRQEELHRQQMMAEQKRLEQEREERELKRQQNEIQLIKDRHLKEKMQQISQTSHGQKVLKKLDEDELKKLDAEQIAVKEAEELQKERREMQQKLKSQEKKVDYLERAKRIEEIPLLEKAVEEKMELAKQLWEQQEQERIAAAIEERNQAVATRERMQRMKEDADDFMSKILEERKNLYLEKLNEFEANLNKERARRWAERKIERKIERRAKWERERAEAAKKKKQEELRIKEEEERKILEAKRAKREKEEKIKRAEKEAEEAERLAKLKKQAEIARAKEAEIEKKLEEERLRDMKTADTWRKGGDRGGYRRDSDRGGYREPKISEVSSWRSEPRAEPKPKENLDDDRKRSNDYGRKWDRFSKDKDRDGRYEKSDRGGSRGAGGASGGTWRRGGDDRPPARRMEGLRSRDDRDDRSKMQRAPEKGASNWRSKNQEVPRDTPSRVEKEERERPKPEEPREAPEDEGWSRVSKR